jgi:hypothetical protein
MFNFPRADALPDLTNMSGRMAQMTRFVSRYSLCRLISDDMIVEETVCLGTVAICYCGGCDPLVVTVCHWLVAVCY